MAFGDRYLTTGQSWKSEKLVTASFESHHCGGCYLKEGNKGYWVYLWGVTSDWPSQVRDLSWVHSWRVSVWLVPASDLLAESLSGWAVMVSTLGALFLLSVEEGGSHNWGVSEPQMFIKRSFRHIYSKKRAGLLELASWPTCHPELNSMKLYFIPYKGSLILWIGIDSFKSCPYRYHIWNGPIIRVTTLGKLCTCSAWGH